MKRRPYIIIALILTMLATAGCEKIVPQRGEDYGEGVTNAVVEPNGPDHGIFDPLSDIGQRALTTFTASLAALIVVLSALIPWLILLFFMSWGVLKFLRAYIRHKRAKKKNRD